jgi:hypothetical protein
MAFLPEEDHLDMIILLPDIIEAKPILVKNYCFDLQALRLKEATEDLTEL